MTDETDMQHLNGWTRTGIARARRRIEKTDPPVELRLPNRKSTLELGQEVLTVRQGGKLVQQTADELMIEQMFRRAMGKKKRLFDFEYLYAVANAEEDAALAKPPEISRYKRKKLERAIIAALRSAFRHRDSLIAAGLATLGEDGVLRPVRGARHPRPV